MIEALIARLDAMEKAHTIILYEKEVYKDKADKMEKQLEIISEGLMVSMINQEAVNGLLSSNNVVNQVDIDIKVKTLAKGKYTK